MTDKIKKKLNRQDFIFENCWFQTLTKPPGSLQMQQFQVGDCEQCRICLFDSNAGVFVDDCKFCHLFIGPSQSSIFIRNCHYMTIICLTQQFRVRDCTHCRIWLWCESQPIIESSHDLQFYPFEPGLGYEELGHQMKQANLKLWNNNWFDIYDFTPGKYQATNYTLCATTNKQSHILRTFTDAMKQAKLVPHTTVIPLCKGTHQKGQQNYTVVYIVPAPGEGIGLAVLHARVGRCPDQLVTALKEPASNKVALFAKISGQQVEGWRQWGLSNSNFAVKLITQARHKQILESTVFVPFADQR